MLSVKTFVRARTLALVLLVHVASLGLSAHAQEASEAPVGEEVAVDWMGGKPWAEWETLSGDWNGARVSLAEHGVFFGAGATFDWFGVWSGGASKKDSFHSLIDFNIGLDLDPLLGWKGANFLADFYVVGGGDSQVGAFQGPSSIEGDHRAQLGELWFEYSFFEEKFRAKAGKIDANSEFGFVENAGEFLNSGAAVPLSIVDMPTFPDPAFGALLFWYPTPSLYSGFGYFDGAGHDGVPTGSRGPKTFFDDDVSDSHVWFFEAGSHWHPSKQQGVGRVAVGAYHHDAVYNRFAGGTKSGVTGYYAIVEQHLHRSNPSDIEDSSGLRGAIFVGYTPGTVSDAEYHFGLALAWQGICDWRPDDDCGIYLGHVDLSDEPGAGYAQDETVIELYYKIQVTPFFSVKPDLQWFRNLNGNPALDNAVQGGLRIEVTL